MKSLGSVLNKSLRICCSCFAFGVLLTIFLFGGLFRELGI